jgi:hypothetical protein
MATGMMRVPAERLTHTECAQQQQQQQQHHQVTQRAQHVTGYTRRVV